MKLEERIKAFNDLGQEIKALSSDRFKSISKKAEQQNPWFTSDNVRLAIDGICNFLNEDELRKWASNYNLNPASPKTVGVAGRNVLPVLTEKQPAFFGTSIHSRGDHHYHVI